MPFTSRDRGSCIVRTCIVLTCISTAKTTPTIEETHVAAERTPVITRLGARLRGSGGQRVEALGRRVVIPSRSTRDGTIHSTRTNSPPLWHMATSIGRNKGNPTKLNHTGWDTGSIECPTRASGGGVGESNLDWPLPLKVFYLEAILFEAESNVLNLVNTTALFFIVVCCTFACWLFWWIVCAQAETTAFPAAGECCIGRGNNGGPRGG